MRFFKNVHFWGPNWVGGAWYGIFFICEKPALRAGLIFLILIAILLLILTLIMNLILFFILCTKDWIFYLPYVEFEQEGALVGLSCRPKVLADLRII